jgi:hypothetical protein
MELNAQSCQFPTADGPCFVDCDVDGSRPPPRPPAPPSGGKCRDVPMCNYEGSRGKVTKNGRNVSNCATECCCDTNARCYSFQSDRYGCVPTTDEAVSEMCNGGLTWDSNAHDGLSCKY